jgi:hypothetical protein
MELERKKLLSFNRQLRRVYAIAGVQMMVSFIGLCCIICGVNISYVIHTIVLTLACVVIIYFQPWKITVALHLGSAYKARLENVIEEIKDAQIKT